MLSLTSLEPVLSCDHLFENPAKLIKNPEDMAIWEKSEAYYEYLGFINAINDAVRGKSNSQGRAEATPQVLKVVQMLDKMDKLLDETPPVQQPQRFGNQAFRTWHAQLVKESFKLLQECMPEAYYRAIQEITSYLLDSFGNPTRIDYGTGHEISFIMFLCSLFKIGLFAFSDRTATGCAIFPRYLQLVRKLQTVYRMEPAGSHGVWSLDDYQFVPFIWGSSQLIGHSKIEPASSLDPKVVECYSQDFMFLSCIEYINSVKTGPFAEHSNQLWSISGVSSWSKVNTGLIKMYKAEVLCKFPVIQHMVFGSLFTLSPAEHRATALMNKPSVVRPVKMPDKVKSSQSDDSWKSESNKSGVRSSSDSSAGSMGPPLV